MSTRVRNGLTEENSRRGPLKKASLHAKLGNWQYLVAILVLSVALRLGVAIFLGDTVPPAKDETSYSVLASRLADGYGYSFPEPWYPFAKAGAPTSHWSFLYTALVAAIYSVTGVHPIAVRLLSAAAGGILLPWMVYRLSRRALPGMQRVALVAAGCTAIYAYFVLFSAQLMTETPFIICVLWSLERALAMDKAISHGQRLSIELAAGLGISLGLATLFRQTVLPWAAVLFLWLLLRGARSSRLVETARVILASGAIIVLLILPFTIRNYLVYHEFLLLNSNAGYAMYSAQHPMHGTDFEAFAAAPLPLDLFDVAQNEAQWDRLLMARGIQFVADEPARYMQLSLSRVSDFFMFWPSAETALINNIGRVASFGLFLPFMVYGLWLARERWQELQLLYIFMAFYTVLHLMTWSMIRYRLPVDAVLIVFAALALVRIADKSFLRGRVTPSV